MKRISFIYIFILLISVSCSLKDKSVHISGVLSNGSTNVQLLQINANNIYDTQSLTSILDSTDNFEFNRDLDKPSYFKMNGLNLFLCPGDDLNIEIKKDKKKDKLFTGSASEACNYLRTIPYFAAASFLKGGIALRHKAVSKESLATFVDSCVSARLDVLNAIKDAHPDFLRIEKMRIFLNAANTFFQFCTYDAKINKLSRATISQESKKLIKRYRTTIAAYLECLNQPENIILPECRAILKDCKRHGFYTQYCSELEDFMKLNKFISRLKQGVSLEMEKTKIQLQKSLKNPGYINELETKWFVYACLLPGKIAPDFSFELPNGDLKKLSDYKGKLIVIDMWATWCGPCRYEKPYFAELGEKYANKPVVFLAMSTDRNIKAWKKMVSKHGSAHHYIDGRVEGKEIKPYNITFIPRFIVIDQEFKMVDAFASRPSNPKFEELINTCL